MTPRLFFFCRIAQRWQVGRCHHWRCKRSGYFPASEGRMIWGNTLREHTPTREASYTEAEWITKLGEAYGLLCATCQRGAGAELDSALDAYIRLCNQWRRERES